MPRIIIDYDTDTIGEDTSTTDVITALESLLPYVFSNVVVRDDQPHTAVIKGLRDTASWLQTHEEHWDVFDTESDDAGMKRYGEMQLSLAVAALSLVVIGRRGELTILIEDLEQLYHESGVSDRTIASMVYRHVQDVQAMEGGEYATGNSDTDSS